MAIHEIKSALQSYAGQVQADVGNSHLVPADLQKGHYGAGVSLAGLSSIASKTGAALVWLDTYIDANSATLAALTPADASAFVTLAKKFIDLAAGIATSLKPVVPPVTPPVTPPVAPVIPPAS